ncbi:putative ABC transporter permease subunit [Brevibacillus nitrificans]|uniref:putative ABC transporter permease subunit n=1 Tax=Brevibacillus nitrificans TaxID=651560 RepID=UPI0028673AB8|nr:hypothetical protein [Brevibacillus nitrificans]MDR7318156.1 ABC-2 type transport system permease protein [Brevibacillus nitrificans]
MNKVLLLTKIMLKNAGSSLGSKKGSGWKTLLILLAIGVGLIPLMAALVVFVAGLYDGLAQIGQEGALLGLGIAGTSLAIFLLGIVYVLSVFYFSQDVEHFLPMPIAPGEILGAKFLVALLYEYLTALTMIAPIFITYGVKSGGGFLYYLFALLVFVALPVIPLTLAILLVMVFMRYTNIGKYKDRFRLLGGLIAIAGGLGFQAFVQRQTSGTDSSVEQLQQMIAAGEQGLLGIVTKLFPASKLGALAILESSAWSGFAYLLGFFAIAVAGLLLFLSVGNRLYFSGVMGIGESRAKRKKIDEAAFQKGIRPRPMWLAYADKEWKVLWRTPAFFMNCALSSIFFPLFGLVPLLSRQDSAELLASLSGWLQGGHMGGISLAVAFSAFVVMASTNSTSITAITREGQGIFLSKTLPIPAGQLLVAKLIPGTLLSVISMALLVAEAAWFIQLPSLFIILAVVVGIPGILFVNLLGLILDMQMPKLEWGSEQEAVKQNLNPLFSMLMGMVTAALCIVLAFSLEASLLQMGVGLFVLFVLADLFLFRLLLRKGPSWLEKMEG